MIVRLTYHQTRRIRDAVTAAGPANRVEHLLEWFANDVASGGAHRVDVQMPAVAWKWVYEVMFDHCYGTRVKPKVSETNATKAVRAGLNLREPHPALYGMGALGGMTDVIPAWDLGPEVRLARGQRWFSPYPTPDAEFVVLMPTVTSRKHQKITQWVVGDPPAHRLFDESEHWKFMG